ncbi:MAG: sigma-70 family RNA polymerase sigma factor [Clostridia bacterium]|nr:MAG: sigma-70 family RNA polymerase sigma factor [Clostridia bacterium]
MSSVSAYVEADEKEPPVHSGTPVDFEAIYSHYLNLLYWMTHRFCSPGSPDFEDYLQEAAIALWEATQSYDPHKGNANAFIANCVRCRLINYLKAERRRQPTISLDAQPDDANGLYERLGLPSANVEAIVIGREERKNLIDSLTQLERNCALLFAWGFSYDEVARVLGITTKSVDNALRRVRLKGCRAFTPLNKFRGGRKDKLEASV